MHPRVPHQPELVITGATSLCAKVFLEGDPEPGDCTVTAFDPDNGPQGGGALGIGVRARLSLDPVTFCVDDVVAVEP
jgi:hypothetical protein